MYKGVVMDIHMSDIMLHIDEDLDSKEQSILEFHMRAKDGVIGLGYHSKRPHLMIVEYDRDVVTPKDLLCTATNYGLHAELVGFL